jgi:hypothetical protein
MSRRSRWIALGLVGVGLFLVCWLTLPGGRMEVQLIMLGYTNVLHGNTNISILMFEDAVKQQQGKRYVAVHMGTNYQQPVGGHFAVLLATNAGSVPVELYSGIRSQDFNDPTFAKPTAGSLPAVLNPGESVTVRVTPPFDSRWRTAVLFQRHIMWDRLYGKAWATGNRKVQATMVGYLPSPKVGTAPSGWITNTLRDALFSGSSGSFFNPTQWTPAESHILDEIDSTNAPARRFHISAPPPPVPTDMLERLRSREQGNP